ncbi:hypothetical protein [Shumkonia mesophila]|uniref:hypothetical protein n=1 Tax=Shumkonia mesophila TaxID=2838854 RepID=UPI0029346A39|nr:hypothetical protein [Shumkonia mesophila]
MAALADLQDTDSASKSYGNVRWYHGDATVVDYNGVEFTTRMAMVAWILFRERMAEQPRQRLESLLRLARTGIVNHKVSVAYTNIYLMKAWNLIALGEQFDDPKLAEEGRSHLRQWLAFTARVGITEYLSPDYYYVDLENLALIANLARSEEARALARRGLDIVWTDVALNWYRPAERLGGPHSRSYNRLFNSGRLDDFAARAGWTAGGQRRRFGPFADAAWVPPSAMARHWWDAPRPRFVTARFGEAPHRRYSHYLGNGFSIASAESHSTHHDNALLMINLGGGRDVPVINAFMDGRRDHYGLNRTLEAGSGHMKAMHLAPFIASVQNGPEVLFVAAVQDGRGELTAQETVITLPADADYWLDGRPLDVFRKMSAWRPEPAPDGGRTTIAIGRRDGRIEVAVGDGDETAGVGLAHYAAAEPGATYRLRATLQGGPFSLYLNFLDADRRLIGRETIKAVPGGPGFSVYDHSAVAPVGTAWCKAWLYSPITARTEARVSDLQFERLAKDAGKTPETLARFDFQPYVAQEIPIPGGSTLVIRRQDAAAALRPLGAWDIERRLVPFVLVNDGLAHRALRLTATHSPVRTEGRGVATLWAHAAEGLADEAAFTAFMGTVQAIRSRVARDGDKIDVSVDGVSGPLRVVADIAGERRLVRQGMPAVDPDAALVVDGKRIERLPTP